MLAAHKVYTSSSNIRRKQAYTMVEFSIFLAVLSLLLLSGAAVFVKKNEATSYKLTMDRIAKIEDALKTFFDVNQYIPCPAVGNAIETSSQFGYSVTYDTTNHVCTAASLNNYVGMVPVRTLNIPDEYAYDGWGRKFSFRVGSGLGNSSDFMNYYGLISYYNGDIYRGDIEVVDLAGYSRTKSKAAPPYDFSTGLTQNAMSQWDQKAPYNYGAAYAIVSYGPDGLGAWHKNDTTSPSLPPSTGYEYQNARHLTSSPSNYYIQDDPTYLMNDIVVFKKKTDMMPPRRTLGGTSNVFTTGLALHPLKIPQYTCANANIIVNSSQSGSVPGVSPSSLASQVYLSALAVKTLCDNPPPGPVSSYYSSKSSCMVNPRTIQPSNLQIWLDAGDPNGNGTIPSNGSVVNPWVDKSGNASNSSVYAGSPTYYTTANAFPAGKAAIYFNGSASYKINISSLQNSNFTVFAMHARADAGISGTAPTIIAGGTGSPDEGFFFGYEINTDLAGSAIYLGLYADDVGGIGPRFNYQPGVPTMMMGFLDTTNGHGKTIYSRFNDATTSQNNFPNRLNALSLAGQGYIGYSPWGGSWFTGYVSEIIIYNTALSFADIKAIEGYLIRRWITGECP